MIKKGIFQNKALIVFLLILFILHYTFYFERSQTIFTIILQEIIEIMNADYSEAELNSLENFFQIFKSMYFQVPAHFFSTLFNLYLTSFILYLGMRLQKKFWKKEIEDLTYSNVVSIYYISLYAVMINFFIQSIIMMATGRSVDILDNSYYLSFWGIFTLLQVGIVIFGLYKKYRIILVPSILYSCIIIFQLGIQLIF